MPIPSRFFVTSGKATSDISEMNAFDQALVDAGISEANLVPVSSVLPKNIKEVQRQVIERGAITFCVMSRVEARGEQTISAGLAYAIRDDGMGGYVAEGHCNGHAKQLEKDLEARAKQMAAHRGIKTVDMKYRHVELNVPAGKYGSCVVALVFMV